METAEIILVGEQLAEVLETELAESGLDLSVAFAWEIEFDLTTFTQRKVIILPTGYRPVAPASRKDDNTFDVDLSIIIAERYRETPRPPAVPKVWINERVSWIQERIFNLLANTANPLKLDVYPNSVDLTSYWSQYAEVTEVCSLDYLRHNKLFWSEVEVTLRRIL